ncbi:MAG TPA: ISNCY family transposase [Myxococcota bacterium]|nr:ISNCY family transposase [Myxococcota bacterium]
MSAKERRRLVVLSELKEGKLPLVEAAAVMRVSYRQAKRIWRRYRQAGDAGLVHRSRGRPGNRRKPESVKKRILKRYGERYPDFGPTLAAEHLEREGLRVDHETLRRWLKASGQWQPRRRRQKHRQWRERKASFGEMLQMDGSHHDWFEGRRQRAVLMVAVDDATNRVMARFFEGETTAACYELMERWFGAHGMPQSLYVDRDSIYRCEREPTVAEQLAGEEACTQFGRAMKELGVELILANSPQAKGRVERMHAVMQDRLVREMRLLGIRDLQKANEHLERVFLPAYNRRFARKAHSEADVHLKPPRELERILSWMERRKVQRDWTLCWGGRWFQIGREHQGLNLVGQEVEVRLLRDGRLKLLKGGQELRWRELPAKPARVAEAKPTRVKTAPPREGGWVHPWKRFGIAVGTEYWKAVRSGGGATRSARAPGGG